MKRILKGVLIVLWLSSCGDKPRPGYTLNPKVITTVEGCEYFIVDAHRSYTYVHKGNCSNPIHYPHIDTITKVQVDTVYLIRER